MIDLYFIKTLEVRYLNKTLESFYTTLKDIDIKNFNISIVDELETREDTLNKILGMRDKNNDLLIIADDIVFTDNWYENLITNLPYGDIVGFSMINPKKNILHNNGFDFIKIDDKLTYLPFKSQENVDILLDKYRECDAVVGCAMYIKKEVLDKDIVFPKEGCNRWGELLFSAIAKQKYNFKTVVLCHKLFHYSISSKQKSDAKLSSISWLIENKLWQSAVKKYLYNIENIPKYKNQVSNELINLFNKNNHILIYGCGTVADIILSNVQNKENIDIASGLNEEVGMEFNGLKIKDISKIDLKQYDFIIISAVGYEDEIIDRYFYNMKNIIKLSKDKYDKIINIGVKL
jgi:hypothetical protein